MEKIQFFFQVGNHLLFALDFFLKFQVSVLIFECKLRDATCSSE